jgi:hypothetical protein
MVRLGPHERSCLPQPEPTRTALGRCRAAAQRSDACESRQLTTLGVSHEIRGVTRRMRVGRIEKFCDVPETPRSKPAILCRLLANRARVWNGPDCAAAGPHPNRRTGHAGIYGDRQQHACSANRRVRGSCQGWRTSNGKSEARGEPGFSSRRKSRTWHLLTSAESSKSRTWFLPTPTKPQHARPF